MSLSPAVKQILFQKKKTGVQDPFLNNVVLYLKGQGANGSTSIIDSSPNPKTITVFGNAQISTVKSKYGASSIRLDGTGDYLSADISSQPFNIRTGSWTLENWQSIEVDTNWANFTGNTGNEFYILDFGGRLYLGDGAINNISPSFSNNLGLFEHIAASFDGTTYRLFRNGILVGSSTTLLANNSITSLFIGARPTQPVWSNAYTSHSRLTNICRYTANFNPETDTFMS